MFEGLLGVQGVKGVQGAHLSDKGLFPNINTERFKDSIFNTLIFKYNVAI